MALRPSGGPRRALPRCGRDLREHAVPACGGGGATACGGAARRQRAARRGRRRAAAGARVLALGRCDAVRRPRRAPAGEGRVSTVACPTCGKATPAGFPRCAHCGAQLAAATTAREERKVVTVLFCDLVGFTQRSEAMDPEDVRTLLRGYHEHLRGELERFGGTVEKFVGDAVVAVFGAPTAHEDDPARAVRAALAIRDWAREQEGLELRIAVHTGEALVTLGAQPGEGLVAGDVVNTAARLQAAA